jgi:hypothetical protein
MRVGSAELPSLSFFGVSSPFPSPYPWPWSLYEPGETGFGPLRMRWHHYRAEGSSLDDGIADVAPYWWVEFPVWPLIVASAILPAWSARQHFLTRRARRRAANGLCPHCGYDMRGNRERCSECGWNSRGDEAQIVSDGIPVPI